MRPRANGSGPGDFVDAALENRIPGPRFSAVSPATTFPEPTDIELGFEEPWPGEDTFDSSARGVSGDGSVIAGDGGFATGQEAVRWTQSTGMEGLGFLPGATFLFSEALAVSEDGSTIVGRSESGSGTEAFRWTASGGMQGLGDLPGGAFFSHASAVSADGSIVVGAGFNAIGSEALLLLCLIATASKLLVKNRN